MIELKPEQKDAVLRMRCGNILCGDVGSGKSRTALAFYYLQEGGRLEGNYVTMNHPRNLYIITTAQKRDKKEWEDEMIPFYISTNKDLMPYKDLKVVVDSWNNVSKYVGIEGSFFIFDEQRVVGKGEWVKSFLKIAKSNDWILLSATPGDKWEDYIPVFIANGFYKTRSEFNKEHIEYEPGFSKWPKVRAYHNTGRLMRLRRLILVDINIKRHTIQHHEDIFCEFDRHLYSQIIRERWDPWKDEPLDNASALCYTLRKCVNLGQDRQVRVLEVFEKHPKLIIFYNFDYELEVLRTIFGAIEGVEMAEWNGHLHQPLPEGKKWVYLAQYTAGAEGWNCIKTDTILFFSQNYSYKTMVQAAGRINRMNTPFIDLYFYHFKSRSGIDLAISKALSEKKKFNESDFYGKLK